MAIQVERMVAILEARLDKYEKGLARAAGQTSRQFTAIERRGKQMESRLRNVGAGIGRVMASGIAAGLSVRGMQRLSDAATRIDNSLKVAGLSGQELEKVYNRLRDSATKNAAPIEALVELYGRAALVQKELGISGEELLGFTDKIALALRVSGKSAAESSGALLQLSQALGSGTVRAEEFNSILEGALPIAQAAAAGLKEAGGSVAKLRQLVVDGEISSQAFFRAFEAGAPMLEEKVANATFTVSQATSNLGTALIDVAREFNNSTGASERFAGGINNAAEAIADFDVSGFISKIQEAHGALDRFLDDVANSNFMERFAEFVTGTELTVGKPVAVETLQAENDLAGLERQIKILEDRINANKEMAIDTTEAQAQLDGLIAQANAFRAAMAGGGVVNDQAAANTINQMVPFSPLEPMKTAATQVSLKDFAPPPGGGGGGSGRGRRRGGGGGGQNEFAREMEQIEERTAAIQAESAAMAGINPLIEDYGFALEKARTSQDLLTAAKRAGIAVTPELKAKIEELATGYANASAEADKLAESQDRARQAADDFRELGKDVLGGFIKDLQAGKSASEALQNALAKVADKLLEIGLNSLFSGKGGLLGGGGGGLLGGILIPGILHSGGVAGRDGYGHGRSVSPSAFAGARRYHSGGVAGLRPDEVPAILQRGEIVLPRGAKSGGSETVRLVLQDDSGRMAEIADQQIRTRSGTIVQIAVQRSQKATQQNMPGYLANAQARSL